MLDNEKINEYSRLLKECEAAKQAVQKLNTEITVLKNQGVEKLKEKGYNNLADAAKIDEEIIKIEAEIEADIPKMQEYIRTVNEKVELKEKILMS